MDAKGFELLMSAKILGEGGGVSMDAKGFERLMAAKILGKGGGGEIKELEGVPPLTFTANGQSLLDYLISGNTVQTGTPTPESPIMPNGCGERTENLCDENNINQGYYAYADGQHEIIGTWVNTYYIAIKSNTEYTAKFKTIYGISRWYGFVWYDSDKHYISTTNTQDNPTGCELTATSPANASFCVFNINAKSATALLSPSDVIYFMLNEGSTALPYEPYGYKLPLTSAGQDVDIYLGEAQTTRRIKKLVLTGREAWTRSTQGRAVRVYTPQIIECMPLSPAICTHFNYSRTDVMYPNIGEFVINLVKVIIFGVDENTFVDVDTWKSYLAAQYAAGTPVTIWYVLAEPETAVVNEPLMKIGEYADTVSMEQAGVSIPTNKGSTTLDVDTTIKPSNVYIKYRS